MLSSAVKRSYAKKRVLCLFNPESNHGQTISPWSSSYNKDLSCNASIIFETKLIQNAFHEVVVNYVGRFNHKIIILLLELGRDEL